MSNTARKARKRAGIPFVKAQKVATVRVFEVVDELTAAPLGFFDEVARVVEDVQPLSAEEYATVQRFGLDQPDGKIVLNHVAFGFAIVVVALLVVLVGVVAGVWLVMS